MVDLDEELVTLFHLGDLTALLATALTIDDVARVVLAYAMTSFDVDHCVFAVDDGVRPGFSDIQATVTIDSPAHPDDIERLKVSVDRHCPVLDILRHATPVRLDLVIAAGKAAPAAA